MTVNGASNSGGNNRLDNIIFSADAVPAPGAMALLGVAGLCANRRRR
jgi:MYXO-CTERM domain-containing protein